MTRSVRFERPPVRGVTLTVFFAQISNLQVSHLSALREDWRDEYPATSEKAPRLPRFPEGDDDVFVAEEPWGFFPYVTFSTRSGDRRIAIQQDRFVIEWKFGKSTDETRQGYPGYLALRAELQTRFEQFAEQVKRETGATLEPKAANCRYRNIIENASALDIQWGIATGWSSVEAWSPEVRSAEWLGVRLHYCRTEENHNCSTTVSLESDQDEPCQLLIVTDREVPEDAESEESAPLAGLNYAHAEATKHFLACTNPDLRKQWGEMT